MAEMRGTAMLDVPIETFAKADEPEEESDSEKSSRPRRTRIPTLDFWRGERVIYERTKGSATPSIKSVRLNGAPRSESMGERVIPPQAAQQGVPVIVDGQEAEFVSTSTKNLESKLVVLPPFTGGRANPPTCVLPAFSVGHIFVIEGSLRYGFEGECGQANLKAGDHLMLPGYDEELLFTSSGGRHASSGVKFKVILVAPDVKVRREEAPPLTAMGASMCL